MWKTNLFLGKIVIISKIVLYVTVITEILGVDVMTFFFFNTRFLEQELWHLLQKNLECSYQMPTYCFHTFKTSRRHTHWYSIHFKWRRNIKLRHRRVLLSGCWDARNINKKSKYQWLQERHCKIQGCCDSWSSGFMRQSSTFKLFPLILVHAPVVCCPLSCADKTICEALPWTKLENWSVLKKINFVL